MLGELTTAQEQARVLLQEAQEDTDRSFAQGILASSDYAIDTTVNLAVVFNSLFKREGIELVDVHMAIDFQDYLESLGYEVRRKND